MKRDNLRIGDVVVQRDGALGFCFEISGTVYILYQDGVFTDVYYNEDMEKEEYKGTWDTIHEKLADYGFILRYLEGEEHITGYRYEPWHIRYLDNADIAKEIMSRPGLTLEEYLAGASAPKVSIDLDGSEIYTEEELHDAMLAIKCQFASWKGCELHSVRYAGDDQNNDENLAWLNSLDEGADYNLFAEMSKRLLNIGIASIRLDYAGCGDSKACQTKLSFCGEVNDTKKFISIFTRRTLLTVTILVF